MHRYQCQKFFVLYRFHLIIKNNKNLINNLDNPDLFSYTYITCFLILQKLKICRLKTRVLYSVHCKLIRCKTKVQCMKFSIQSFLKTYGTPQKFNKNKLISIKSKLGFVVNIGKFSFIHLHQFSFSDSSENKILPTKWVLL